MGRTASPLGAMSGSCTVGAVSVRNISRRLQDALNHVLANLAAHVLAHSRRKTIVEARANASLRDFTVKVAQVGPSMGYAG